MIASDRMGVLRLIQVLECLRQGLSTPDEVASFFHDLEQLWFGADRPADWPSAWTAVARGTWPSAHRPGGHVRRVPHPPGAAQPTASLTTVVDEDVWYRYHARGREEELADLGVALPPFPIGRDPGKLKSAQLVLAQAGAWAQPASLTEGAWLGRPAAQNANCWVSCIRVASSEPAEDERIQLEELLAALGLEPRSPLWAWMLYRIDPVSLDPAGTHPSMLGARPGFADEGSRWFRVVSDGDAAKRHNRHGWGSTVNLAMVRPASVGTLDTGLPERVIPAVPVESPAVSAPVILPPLPRDASRIAAPDASVFYSQLKRRRTEADIVQEVLSVLNLAPTRDRESPPPRGISA
jgi:hypothetical protein